MKTIRNQLLAKIAALITSALVLVGAGSANAVTLWVGDVSGNLGTVDTSTGVVNVIGSMGVVMTDIAFDPNGNLYGISFDNLYSINTTTAAVTLIGQHSSSTGAKNALVFNSSGTLYAANNALYTLNIATGAATLVGSGGDAYVASGDLAFIGTKLFLSSSASASALDVLVELNAASGAGTLVGNIGFEDVFGLATDNNVDLYGVAGTSVLAVNTSTGAGTAVLDYSGKGLGIAWGSAFYSESGAVPEPATLALFGLGLAGLGAVRRKKLAA